jgi:glutamate--cysteine ligase
MNQTRLQAQHDAIKPLLLQGGFGLEKESLRIDGGGFLVHTPCLFADNKHIVRDFSENQVEVNTPVYPTAHEAVEALEHYNAVVQQKLASLPERELLWPFSNPPYILSERDIPIAQYYGAEAVKTEYREYLSDRYGRYKMAFSGIHINYSFGPDLLQASYEFSDAPSLEAYRDALYLHLAENCVTYGWILTAVMAASPIMDSSYVEKGRIGGDLFQGLATVRCSELGYWNFFAPVLDYTSTQAYAASIQSYIDTGLIRYPSELYYPIRLKSFGDYSLEALAQGISHIELRMVDLNPLVRAGLDVRDVLFSQLFLVWAASVEGPQLTMKDQVQAVQNFKNASHFDLKTVKIVMPDGAARSVVSSARALLDRMDEFYADFGEEVQACLAFQRQKFEDPHTRYAWRIRNEYGEGFVARGLQLARNLQADYLAEYGEGE